MARTAIRTVARGGVPHTARKLNMLPPDKSVERRLKAVGHIAVAKNHSNPCIYLFGNAVFTGFR